MAQIILQHLATTLSFRYLYYLERAMVFCQEETAKCIKQIRENLRPNNLFTELFYAILLC